MATQQQHSHVPKFGGWDNDKSIPYTAFFENARKERSGSVRMNPNDPEQNPEAFNMMIYGNEMKGHVMDDDDDGGGGRIDMVAPQTANHRSARKTNSVDGYYSEGNVGQSPNVQRRNPSTRENSVSKGHVRAEKPPSGRKKNLDNADQGSERSLSMSVASSKSSKQRNGSHKFDANHQRIVSVPKFGAWDETDPKTADGYTILFKMIKEEKQTASATLQPITPPDHKSQARYSSRSRILCCFSSGRA